MGKLIKQASFGPFCGSFGPKWGQIVKNANLGTMGVHTGSHIINGTNRSVIINSVYIAVLIIIIIIIGTAM